MTFGMPWLELIVVTPLIGAIIVHFQQEHEMAHRWAVGILALTLTIALAAFFEYGYVETAGEDLFGQVDKWSPLGPGVLVMDDLNAPLIPLAALQFFLATLVTLRTKIRRFSFPLSLISASLVLATLCSDNPWWMMILLSAGTIPSYVELTWRNRPTRNYVIHMGLFVALLWTGYILSSQSLFRTSLSSIGFVFLIGAVLIRNGIVPLHCWLTDLFENGSFGNALLTVLPMIGAYSAVRIALPVTPGWALGWVSLLSLITAVYAAAMALVQIEARRCFCYLFLSQASLVLVGLETPDTETLTGSLAIWLSIGLSQAGFGLTLRMIESRIGKIKLDRYHGLYDQMPLIAVFFLLTGLASVGFPGTFGFISTEILIDGMVQANPAAGIAMVIALALNGISILQIYFRIFGGVREVVTVSLRARRRERMAVLLLVLLIVGGGLVPQPGLSSRFLAAQHLQARLPASSGLHEDHPH